MRDWRISATAAKKKTMALEATGVRPPSITFHVTTGVVD
jgi:hypothetical protein